MRLRFKSVKHRRRNSRVIFNVQMEVSLKQNMLFSEQNFRKEPFLLLFINISPALMLCTEYLDRILIYGKKKRHFRSDIFYPHVLSYFIKLSDRCSD
jgi:hypothetical protein